MPSIVEAVISTVATKTVAATSMKTVTKTKDGVMVLGMHHLGMSMLPGFFVQQFGYNVGKLLLIGTGPLNPKGHFELYPAILQNIVFL